MKNRSIIMNKKTIAEFSHPKRISYLESITSPLRLQKFVSKALFAMVVAAGKVSKEPPVFVRRFCILILRLVL